MRTEQYPTLQSAHSLYDLVNRELQMQLAFEQNTPALLNYINNTQEGDDNSPTVGGTDIFDNVERDNNQPPDNTSYIKKALDLINKFVFPDKLEDMEQLSEEQQTRLQNSYTQGTATLVKTKDIDRMIFKNNLTNLANKRSFQNKIELQCIIEYMESAFTRHQVLTLYSHFQLQRRICLL